MIKIEVEQPGCVARSFLLTAPIIIGKGAPATLVVNHWKVAQCHVIVRERRGTLWIQDQETWFGTRFNGRRIVAETPVDPLDVIHVGPAAIRVAWCEPPKPSCTDSSLVGSSSNEASPYEGSPTERSPTEGSTTEHSPTVRFPTERFPTERSPIDRFLIEPSPSGSSFPENPSHPVTLTAPTVPTASPVASLISTDSTSIGSALFRSASAASTATGSVPPGLPSAGSASARSLAEASLACLQQNLSGEGNVATPWQVHSATDSSEADVTDATRSAKFGSPWERGGDAIALRKRLQQQLRDALDLRREDVSIMTDLQLRARAHELLAVLMREENNACPPDYCEEFLQRVLDDAVGLGPLEALLKEDAVTEIMVNRFDEIYVERRGRLTRVDRTFSDNDAVLGVIERIVAPLGRRIDESSPMVDARLPDGSRVNGVIPPIALKGPTLTIRKFSAKRLSLEELVAAQSIHPYMAAFLATSVARKKNIIVSGGTGSGKTTLLNILSGLIGPGERVVTIEDAAELKLPHEHVVALEARPANVEGQGLVTIRDLVRNALRMRPDRIVVGECRGGEAFDMLAAMNTGHAGSLTTLHANTPRDALARLETMILMAGMDLPLTAIREHIAGAVDLIVQQVRREDGKRLVTDISEVTGMESGQIQLQPLFQRQRHAMGWTSTGVVPAFVEDWREEGVYVDSAWFRLGLSLEEARECTGPLR